MGLDGIELMMSIEERFGVSLTDAEAETCLTPAILIDLITSKLRTANEWSCISQRAFHLLRKGLVSTTGLRRSEVHPDSRLPGSVLNRDARAFWASLRDSVQARSWPELARPRWVVAISTLLTLATFALLWSTWHWCPALCSAGIVARICAANTRHLRSHIPDKYAEVRDLVPFAATSEFITWSRCQIAALVRQLVIEQLDLKPHDYREDAHFVRDLGLD